mmetsp:Transcript_48714/g.110328  ORF Transcript_48714/g.110328 Transcript_48714/m.110328 type:complete len:152 (-) Transcript_48714:321-776(-)
MLPTTCRNRALAVAAICAISTAIGRVNASCMDLLGAFPSDAQSLLQESLQVRAREAELDSDSDDAPPSAAAARRQMCQTCGGEPAVELESELPELVEAKDSVVMEDMAEEEEGLCFLQRFAKPYRLRAVGIAVVGFGLLRLDAAPAMLLAL